MSAESLATKFRQIADRVSFRATFTLTKDSLGLLIFGPPVPGGTVSGVPGKIASLPCSELFAMTEQAGELLRPRADKHFSKPMERWILHLITDRHFGFHCESQNGLYWIDDYAAVCASALSCLETATTGSKNQKASAELSCDENMAATIVGNPEAKNWSSGKWHEAIGFSTSTICGTKTWKTLKVMRGIMKAERQIEKDQRARKPSTR